MKKKIIGLVIATVMLVGLVIPAYAQGSEIIGGNNNEVAPIETVENGVAPFLLSPGPKTQYPSAGGTWQYGFWNVKVRSYYTVNRCHGSTVELNGSKVRSVDTISGKKSIAEKWAVNLPGNDDRYWYRVCD
ncbi:lactococcin 972 family bacteriocin [Clostridiaceae bacterium M8S5]|nr:lactococcin 972 family bacteriocin [Clostridiaceae bacterium M8S5]